jgi:hypothetical protein
MSPPAGTLPPVPDADELKRTPEDAAEHLRRATQKVLRRATTSAAASPPRPA